MFLPPFSPAEKGIVQAFTALKGQRGSPQSAAAANLPLREHVVNM